MILINKSPCVQWQDHEDESGNKDDNTDAVWNEISPNFLEKRHIEFSFAWNTRLPRFKLFFIEDVLMNWPIFTVSGLLTRLCPFLLLLPFCYEDDTPDHYNQTVQKVSRAIVRSVVSKIVEYHCRYADYSWEDEPSLHKWHKIKVCFRICSNVTSNTVRNDRSKFWLFVNRNKLNEACMFHYISKRVYFGLLMKSCSLSFNIVIE